MRPALSEAKHYSVANDELNIHGEIFDFNLPHVHHALCMQLMKMTVATHQSENNSASAIVHSIHSQDSIFKSLSQDLIGSSVIFRLCNIVNANQCTTWEQG